MYVINDEIRELVFAIDTTVRGPRQDVILRKLVLAVKASCARADTVEKYAAYSDVPGVMQPLPTDENGYVVAHDVLTDEAGFYNCWLQSGIVASKAAVTPLSGMAAMGRVYELVWQISNGQCDLNIPATWASLPQDSSGVPLLTRGFFEVYHDSALARMRQAVRVYLHFAVLWGRHDLWTSFDRIGVKLPGHEESKALPLHVDQNPNVHPRFRTVQGVLALTDCPVQRGTFVGVPGSKGLFPQYAGMALNKGEYVELDLSNPVAATLQSGAQACPLQAGDLISWDSRTTHANSENKSQDTRVVAYIACGPASEADARAVEARRQGFESGVGSNDRDALMHASKPPRFTDPATLAAVRAPEQLTLLGRLLYGQARYTDL